MSGMTQGSAPVPVYLPPKTQDSDLAMKSGVLGGGFMATIRMFQAEDESIFIKNFQADVCGRCREKMYPTGTHT